MELLHITSGLCNTACQLHFTVGSKHTVSVDINAARLTVPFIDLRL